MSRVNIRPWLPGVVGLLVFVLAAVHGYRLLDQVVDHTDARKAARQTLLDMTKLLSLLKDVETGQRGYIISGDPAYLEPYDAARRDLQSQHAALEPSLVREGVTEADLRRLRGDIQVRLDIAARNVDTRRHVGHEAARQGILSGEGKSAMDALREDFGRIEAHLSRRIDALNQRVAELQGEAYRAGILLTLAGIGLLLLAYGLLLREQRRRVAAEQALAVRADEAARRRGEELGSVFEALPDLYFRLAADGTILDYRGRREAVYVPAEQFLGKRMQAVLPAPVGERFSAEIDALGTGTPDGYRRFEYVLPMPAGERHFEARLGRLPDRDDVVMVVRDIEDRHQAEVTIRKWADAFEHCAHGIALGDARTNRFLACNPAFGKLLGRDPDELVGQPILDAYAPGEHARLKERIAQVDATGRLGYEADMQRRDGTAVHVQLDLVSVRAGDGKPLYRVATIQDISARRAAFAAVEQAREDLRAFVRKLDRDIESERRRLAREVHDQIGQVFTALKLKLLGCQPGTAITPATRVEFDHLLDDGIRVARRIAADLRPAMLDDLGLGPALEHYARQFAERAGLVADVALAPDARLAPAQATQLFRIAQEALTNVARHAGATRVRLRGAVVEGRYVLTLEDDGKGMATPDREGLGIRGMQERAELVGANLVLGRSDLGGVSVSVHLPLVEEET